MVGRISAVGRRLAHQTAWGVLGSVAASSAILAVVLLVSGMRVETTHPVLGWVAAAVAAVVATTLSAMLVYRLVRRQVALRLETLAEVLRGAEAGDHLRRFQPAEDDEFADVERAFNALMDQFSGLAASALHSDLMVKWAQSELRLREELLAKSNELAAVNEALVRKVREASDLLRIAEVASASLEMGRLLDRLGRTLVETLGVEELLVLLPDPESGDMRVRHAVGVQDVHVLEGSWPSDDPLVRRCIEEGDIQYLPDLSTEPLTADLRGRRRIGGSLVAVPVRGPGSTTGVITLLRREARGFDSQDLDFLRLTAHYVALAVSNATLYRATHERAIHDSLTGLHNRGFFVEAFAREWHRARRTAVQMSVLMIDVDHFKLINDSHGHGVGDVVLQGVARLLRARARKADLLARYGGEEFVVALPGTPIEDAEAIAEAIRASVESTPLPVSATNGVPDVHLTVSVGVASDSLADDSPEALIRRADMGLLSAKSAGRNRVAVRR